MITTFILTAFLAAAPAKTVQGDGTSLSVRVISTPIYDGDAGSTHLRLKAGSEERLAVDWSGVWKVHSHDPERHRYVLTGEVQQGAWLSIRRIRYLSDRSGLYTESQYCGRDWAAFTAVPSKDGRWVAFVGGLGEGATFHLLVLDTRADAMVDLGAPPPAPPPSTDVAPLDLSADCPWSSWPCFHDGWVDLEPGIITFDGDKLIASYGKGDSPKARDKVRTKKSWDLEAAMKAAGARGK